MGEDKNSEWLQSHRDEIRAADYPEATKQAILDFLNAYDPDAMHIQPPAKQGKTGRENTLSTSTRNTYASRLKRTAESLGDITTVTADDLNRHASDLLSGAHESVDDDGMSENSVRQMQITWRSFARFHENHVDGTDLDIDPEDIVLVDREDTKVDERDMFTAEEIQAMRDACRNKRDRALIEMLIYTGQRNNALRQLRYKDVRPEEGESGILYLREDIEGMKGADGKRPLLGAQKAAREWKRAHPTKNPDDAFFTYVYDWDDRDNIEAGGFLRKNTLGDLTKEIADRAGVDKPANPHQFRHYFVTMAISKHGMSTDTVRHLIGHVPESRELEKTYQHLVDDDYIENAELDMGLRETREESLTPAQCPVCDEPLEPSWSRCPNGCMTFDPKMAQVESDVEERKMESAMMIDPDDEETQEAVMAFAEVLEDNPELALKVLELADE